jgi:hypothetical protein
MNLQVFQYDKNGFMLRCGPSGPRLEAPLTGAKAPVHKSPLLEQEGQGEVGLHATGETRQASFDTPTCGRLLRMTSILLSF